MYNLIPDNIKQIIFDIRNQNKYTLKDRHNVFVVGGACRDALMGKIPKDFDLTTSATPEEIAEIFGPTTTCGNNFLVCIVDGTEVATYRKDKTDHAEVAHTLYEDVVRRDFTINGIAYEYHPNPSYCIFIDYVGGMKDVENRILRFIGEPQRRINEDPVRILRGLRFAAKYNLIIDTETYFAMYANRHLLRDIPAERISQEVIKAFSTNNAYGFLRLLQELEMLSIVLPFLSNLNGIDGGKNHNESVLSHCFNVVKAIDSLSDWKLKLACLYHDIGKYCYQEVEGNNTFLEHHKMCQEFIESDLKYYLKMPNDAIDYVKFMARHHMDSLSSKKSIRKLFGRLNEYGVPLKDFIRLRYADKKGNMKHTTSVHFSETRSKYRECLNILNEKPPFNVKSLDITGHDVMTEFNLEPCKEIGIMLKHAFEGVLNEIIPNKRVFILEYLREEF